MAQQQLNVISLEEFSSIQWQPNEVTCQLQERFSLVVKRYQHEVYIQLRSGRKIIKLPLNIFDAICDAQLSIGYIARYLEESTGDQENVGAWLCCYCGLHFTTESECENHEESEHRSQPRDVCFHANVEECIECIYCRSGASEEI